MFRIITKDETKMVILDKYVNLDENHAFEGGYYIAVDGYRVYENASLNLTADVFNEILKQHKDHLNHETKETTIYLRDIEKQIENESSRKEYEYLLHDTLDEQGEVCK